MSYRHRTVPAGDISTHYLEAGDGAPLVLLHGGEYGASAETTWRQSIDLLARDFRVIAPDLAGYGLTDKLYDFADPAGFRIRHLRRFLEAIGIQGAAFVGNSGGGGILLRAAVAETPPFSIRKMATICGNAGLFKTEAQNTLESYDGTPAGMERIMGLLFHDRKWLAEENVKQRYETSILPGSWEAISAARLRRPGYRSGTDPEAFVKKLAAVRIPLLIIACDHDPLNQKGWELRLQKIVPGSKTHRFRHSAHEPQIEEPEEFYRAVKEFFLGG